jgi:[protein-PII] uridylyltransferase
MSTIQKVDSTYPPQFSVALLDDSTPHLEMLGLGRGALKQFLDYQFKTYDDGGAVSELITERSSFIDQFIKKIWAAYIPENVATLIAVGGYGRGELHPYSDIDLLILCGSLDEHKEDFSKFITLLWDLGFDVGSSVRTIEDCITAGLEDITTATNLLESRWITGDYHAFEQLQSIWNRPYFWESKAFSLGKWMNKKPS